MRGNDYIYVRLSTDLHNLLPRHKKKIPFIHGGSITRAVWRGRGCCDGASSTLKPLQVPVDSREGITVATSPAWIDVD